MKRKDKQTCETLYQKIEQQQRISKSVCVGISYSFEEEKG